MTVQFPNIPGNTRVPFFYAEFRSGGTPFQSNARLLLIGQKTSAGIAVANQPILVSDGQEQQFGGAGSMLVDMHRCARRNGPFQEIWWLPVDDLSGGVAATGSITVTGAPLASPATLTVYIGDIRVQTGILAGDTNAQIAANLVAAIAATPQVAVVATVDGTTASKVDLVANHKGTLGNAIMVDTGDMTVDGVPPVTLTIVAMTGGTGDPDLATAVGNLGDLEFDWIASPYVDATNLGRAQALLDDTSGRWSYASQLYGHYQTVHTGTVSELGTLGGARNNQHESIFPCRHFLSPPWKVAAALGAVEAVHLQDAPELSRPLQTLPLLGIAGPRLKSDRLTQTNRQSLYYDGISGYRVDIDGTVLIDRIVTTYHANAFGQADWTYLDIETMAQSMFGIRYLRDKVSSTHGRKALVTDNPGGLATHVTPREIRETILHGYEELIGLGVFESFDLFEASLVVERNATDANRVDIGMNLDHANQLRIVAAAAVNYLQLAA